MSENKDLRTTILDAAVQVFMRYGVGRTRMGDIADEAGVVRQTLYSFFKNKDEILCGAILHVAEQTQTEIQARWAETGDLGARLQAYHELAILPSFHVINASPDARDMVGGYNAKGQAATIQAQQQKIDAFTEMLAEHPDTSSMPEQATQTLAQLIVLGALGLRDHASDEAQLRQLLELHKQGVLAQLHAT